MSKLERGLWINSDYEAERLTEDMLEREGLYNLIKKWVQAPYPMGAELDHELENILQSCKDARDAEKKNAYD